MVLEGKLYSFQDWRKPYIKKAMNHVARILSGVLNNELHKVLQSYIIQMLWIF